VYTLGELADRLDLAFTGDADRTFTGLASLTVAGPEHLSFLSGKRYLAEMADTHAGAVILSREYAASCPADCIIAKSPYAAFARASQLFVALPAPKPGVHSSAVIDSSAQVHPSATVGAGVVLEAGAVVAAEVVLEAGVCIGRFSRVGRGSHIYPHVVLYHDVHLGEQCIVHSQAVLGADGFGFAPSDSGWLKIHQLGGVRIGDRVEIGACSAVDRGTLESTVIEDGVIIDNHVQVGHNCRIGRNTAIAGCVGLAGSTVIGENCTLAGGVGVVGHVSICADVHITGMTMVTKSIDQPGSYSSGTPMSRTSDWKRQAVRFSQLDDIQRRLSSLEREQDNNSGVS
jgi:UDP-3-O-[3-hydroxymyristoyl] glucosamine N-acyltransferase